MILQYKNRFDRNKPVSVHIDNYCAETGISRFWQLFDSWEYNKTEKLPVEEFARFDFILLGSINKAGFNDNLARANVTSHHENYFKVEAFHKIGWQHFTKPSWLRWIPFKFRRPVVMFKPKVYVLRKI